MYYQGFKCIIVPTSSHSAEAGGHPRKTIMEREEPQWKDITTSQAQRIRKPRSLSAVATTEASRPVLLRTL
jgi:hypothetical protein